MLGSQSSFARLNMQIDKTLEFALTFHKKKTEKLVVMNRPQQNGNRTQLSAAK